MTMFIDAGEHDYHKEFIMYEYAKNDKEIWEMSNRILLLKLRYQWAMNTSYMGLSVI